MSKGLVLACAIGAAIAMVVACNNVATSTIGCQGPTAGSFNADPKCTKCMKAACGSQINDDQSACMNYNSCYCACKPTDMACQGGCISQLDSNCQQAEQALTNCVTPACLDTCNGTSSSSGGSSSSSSGGGGDSGGGGG